MTFREILQKLVDDTPGASGAAIMASDGIPIDEYTRSGDVDLVGLAVEFQGAVEQVGKAASVTTGGGMRELVLSTGLEQLYFRRIDEELSLFAVLDRDGIVGKLRYLAAQLESELKAAL
jgi:predicted regulator of Ras-like GTPase activity (Roadblock/LC7/MglB family)